MVAVKGFEPLSPEIRASRLAHWQTIDFDWVTERLQGRIYQRPDGKAEVLELDGFVQMQVLKGERFGPVDALAGYCARPLRMRMLAQGEVWSCEHWAALTRDGTITELWWVAK